MNQEQKKEMYQFYLKMFLFILISYYFIWCVSNNIGKYCAILGFIISTFVIFKGVMEVFRGKY
jgi:hypothetical protein